MPMTDNPNVNLDTATILKATLNEKGELCNAYSPFQNLMSENTETLGDFTTSKLNFDLEHPVDIIPQDSYDGSVNLIINDGKNRPRLINSRFSVQNDTNFLIPDHTGNKDTNIYNESTFNIDTQLISIPLTIPELKFLGLINNAGVLKCGSYNFYFKLSDADGNETEVVQESGIVQVHIGELKDPKSMRMGLLDENSGKAVKFKLFNIDSGFDYVHVSFARNSSGEDQTLASEFKKISFDYPIINNQCDIIITGQENIFPCAKEEFYVDYADINSVKTQAVSNNVLLFGNVDTPEHDWGAILRMSWKIGYTVGTSKNVGYVDEDYEFDEHKYNYFWDSDNLTTLKKYQALLKSKTDETSDCSYAYYNTENIYYKVGYWPDEIYRFGIVYIFEDMSLSPVFNVQGIDFQTLDKDKLTIGRTDLLQKLNDTQDRYIEWDSEPEGYYFNKQTRANSRGVIKFPKLKVIENNVPAPMYIRFDLENIGAGIADPNDVPAKYKDYAVIPDIPFNELLEYHKIKGFFFVRQKRIPTILAQGVVVGLTKEDYGSIPVILDNNYNYISLSFVSSDADGRQLLKYGTDIVVPSKNVTTQAMFIPDAELMEATFNQLFVGGNMALHKIGSIDFKYRTKDNTAYANNIHLYEDDDVYYKATLLNIPEDTKILTDGENYFSTLAGSAAEAYKTKDVAKAWKYTKPQDLTTSDTIIRGQWGAFVGLGLPEEMSNSPYKYGEVYNIKLSNYYDDFDEAVNLDFQRRFNTSTSYHAISDRYNNKLRVTCYRGDCFTSMFTHRILRNFIDPELPTNKDIVDPSCWALNYGVRCTARIVSANKSNLAKEDDGWYIEDSMEEIRKSMLIQALVQFLMGSIIGATSLLILLASLNKEGITPLRMGLTDNYVYYKLPEEWYTGDYAPANVTLGSIRYAKGVKLAERPKLAVHKNGKSNKNYEFIEKTYYLVDHYEIDSPENAEEGFGTGSLNDDSGGYKLKCVLAVDSNGNPIPWDYTDTNQLYPNGFANEIVLAFETYSGNESSGFNFLTPITSLIKLVKYGDGKKGPTRKKVNPKEQEQSAGGINLKAMFKSDDDWELHGLASINRADVNAVGLGQWITFPVCSGHNLALRDIDYSNATEEASFARKRSFYPLKAKDKQDPLRDSNVLNQSSAVSIPYRAYYYIGNPVFIKQEYFTRICNSMHDNANNFTNQFKVIFQTAYKDYSKIYGSITKLVPMANSVYIIFKHGIGVIQLDLNQQSPTDYLPVNSAIISDSLGSMWKDSIILTDYGIIYGVDTVAKKLWMIQGNNVIPFSDHRMSKFLNDNIDMSEFTRTPFISHINVKTHYNAFKHDVMFTYCNDIPYNSDGNCVNLIGDNSDEANKLRESIVRWENGVRWSLCYNEDTKQFTTFYDWYPVESANIDNIYFSFDQDKANEIIESDDTNDSIVITNNGKDCKYISLKKYVIDEAFTNTIKVYYIDSSATGQFMVSKTGEVGLTSFSFYYKSSEDCELRIKLNKVSNKITLPSTDNNWKLFILFIKTTSNLDVRFDFEFITNSRLFLSEFNCKQLDYTTYLSEYNRCVTQLCYLDTMWYNYGIFDFKNFENTDPKQYLEIRDTTSSNVMQLWKHGQAGIYDNQGDIKPTNWYGKQHEFNFEFIVNQPSTQLQKIYNNLKIISNKAEPNKFEYEVVGEGYDWYKYKPVILWANEHVDSEHTLESRYIEILSTTYGELINTYPDFPEIFGLKSDTKILKLPFLKTALVDRLGHKIVDPETGMMYDDNSSETILVKDEQLNEYRVHTMLLGNNISKYGRIRGNMQYLEDLWYSEIRPITFKYAYLEEVKPTLEKILDVVPEKATTVKPDIQLEISAEGGYYNPGESVTLNIIVPDNLKKHTSYVWTCNGDRFPKTVVNPDTDTIGVIRLSDGSVRYQCLLLILGDLRIAVYVYLRPIANKPKPKYNLLYTKLLETRHRDKYIKVKIRYTGEDLVVISMVLTMLLYSKA